MEEIAVAGMPVSHGACVGVGCLSMLAAYDNLITWSEQTVGGPREVIAWPDAACTADGQPRKLPEVWQKLRESTEYLNAERMRVARFRQEMAFLEKRRVAG